MLALSTAVVLLLASIVMALRPAVSVDDRTGTNDLGGPQAQAVLTYLNALAVGDADTALELSAAQPEDTRLLSHDVLVEALDELPLSDISVTSVIVHGARSMVTASYLMGQLRVSPVLPVVRVDDGWRLERGYAEVDLSAIAPIPVRINERPVGQRAAVFPGSYPLSTGVPWLDFGPDDRWLVTSPEDVGPDATPVRLALTPIGREAFVTAAEKAIARCTAVSATVARGCPATVMPRRWPQPQSSSIAWQLDRRSLSELTPAMLATPQARVASAGAVLDFTFSADGTGRGRPARSVQTVRRYVIVHVDMLDRPLQAELR